jgi:hypothetical protein
VQSRKLTRRSRPKVIESAHGVNDGSGGGAVACVDYGDGGGDGAWEAHT